MKSMDINIQEALISVNQVSDVAKKYGEAKVSKEAGDVLQKYYNQYMEKVYQPDNP
jgi:histone H3/H4